MEERNIQRDRHAKRERDGIRKRDGVCVCVCVREREREREILLNSYMMVVVNDLKVTRCPPSKMKYLQSMNKEEAFFPSPFCSNLPFL